VALMQLNFSTWGINTAFGIYLSFDLQHNQFPGARDIDFAFIGSLSLSLALAVAPLSNYISRTFHWRYSLITGTVCLVVGQILAGFSTQIWQLYLTQGVLFAVGLGLTMVVSGPIVTQWFGLKRAFAVGIVSAGSGGGALFYSNITRVTLENVGRKWACVIK
jgi:MFS family permease